jgi:hypothetical protein
MTFAITARLETTIFFSIRSLNLLPGAHAKRREGRGGQPENPPCASPLSVTKPLQEKLVGKQAWKIATKFSHYCRAQLARKNHESPAYEAFNPVAL